MMDWTDRHCRAFHLALTRHARLYAEMAVDKAVILGDTDRLLDILDQCGLTCSINAQVPTGPTYTR